MFTAQAKSITSGPSSLLVQRSDSGCQQQDLSIKLTMIQIQCLMLLVLCMAAWCVQANSDAQGAAGSTNYKVVPVLFKSLATADSGATVPSQAIRKGVLEYDTFQGSGVFKSLAGAGDIQGPGCFGTPDSQGKFKCLAYTEVSIQAGDC